MFKTLKYKYTPTKKERRLLRLLCHISKNLYNSALYTLRQEYFYTTECKVINSDINATLNILTKCKTERTDIISILRNIGQTVPIRQKIKFNWNLDLMFLIKQER